MAVEPAEANLNTVAADAAGDTFAPKIKLPTAKTIASQASQLSSRAGAAFDEAFGSLRRLRT